MSSDNRYFNEALSNFTQDFSYGAAVRHLADLGYTVSEISKQLTYPATKEQIGTIVFKHYINTGIILLDPPSESSGGGAEQISYIKEEDSFGRTSFRRIVKKIEIPDLKYIPCRFGIDKYKNESEFLKSLNVLDIKDRDYILGLPWPVKTVYHIENERMRRIDSKLKKTHE